MSEKILIVKLGALGDMIMNLPHYAFVRSQHPNSHLSLLTRPIYAEFMKFCPLFDEVISDERINSNNPFKLLKIRRQIYSAGFSAIYNFGIGSSKRYGFLINKKTALSFPELPTGFPTDMDMGWLTNADISRFNLQKPYVVVVPGSAPRRWRKRWSPDNYGTLCAFIAKQGLQPVICGGESEKDIAKTIMVHCPQATDLTSSTDIVEVATVMAAAAMVVGNDTGLIHIASALKKPTIILMSERSKHVLAGDKSPHIKPPHVQVLRSDNIDDITTEQVVTAFNSVRQTPH